VAANRKEDTELTACMKVVMMIKTIINFNSLLCYSCVASAGTRPITDAVGEKK
jgi:hypothetical protein